MAHQSTQQKQILTQLKNKRNQGKMWLRKPTHILYPQNIILTLSTKQRNHKHQRKQFIPPKTIKMTQLTKQVNPGLFQ